MSSCTAPARRSLYLCVKRKQVPFSRHKGPARIIGMACETRHRGREKGKEEERRAQKKKKKPFRDSPDIMAFSGVPATMTPLQQRRDDVPVCVCVCFGTVVISWGTMCTIYSTSNTKINTMKKYTSGV